MGTPGPEWSYNTWTYLKMGFVAKSSENDRDEDRVRNRPEMAQIGPLRTISNEDEVSVVCSRLQQMAMLR